MKNLVIVFFCLVGLLLACTVVNPYGSKYETNDGGGVATLSSIITDDEEVVSSFDEEVSTLRAALPPVEDVPRMLRFFFLQD